MLQGKANVSLSFSFRRCFVRSLSGFESPIFFHRKNSKPQKEEEKKNQIKKNKKNKKNKKIKKNKKQNKKNKNPKQTKNKKNHKEQHGRQCLTSRWYRSGAGAGGRAK